MSKTHHDFVADQYGPRASAYVTSAVHASGADLDQIEDFVRGHATARALDLGCGGGHVSYRAAPHVAELVACDLSSDMLDAVNRTAAERGLRNIRTQQAPAERLPFPDASFDIVLSRFSAHHWQGWETGLREARRVLKPDGHALFVDAVAPADPLLDTHLQAIELLRDPSHVRDYTCAEWIDALSRAGFVATALAQRVLRMEFAVWTERTRTSAAHVAAIRSLLDGASSEVRSHFTISEDCSFDLTSLTLEARVA